MSKEYDWEKQIDNALESMRHSGCEMHVDVVDAVMTKIDGRKRTGSDVFRRIEMHRAVKLLAAACFVGVIVAGAFFIDGKGHYAAASTVDVAEHVNEVYGYCFNYGNTDEMTGSSVDFNAVSAFI